MLSFRFDALHGPHTVSTTAKSHSLTYDMQHLQIGGQYTLWHHSADCQIQT